MRLLMIGLMMALALPALADGLVWAPVTVDIYGRAIPVDQVSYQVYQDGQRFGAPVKAAPTPQAAYAVPSCTDHTYTVTALYAGLESVPASPVRSLPCFPAAPVATQVQGAQLLACRIDAAKAWAANTVCQASLKALQGAK